MYDRFYINWGMDNRMTFEVPFFSNLLQLPAKIGIIHDLSFPGGFFAGRQSARVAEW